MRFLLILMALVLWSLPVSVTGALRPPSLMRPQGLMLQSYLHIAELQREVDMLVAQGYVLFAGEIRYGELEGVTGKEFILIRDARSPVYRYGEHEIAVDGSSRTFRTKGIAEGGRAEIGGDGRDVHVSSFLYIPHDASNAVRFRLGWYFYRLATADGRYPESPTRINMLQLIIGTHTVELQPVNNYRVYRGQFDYRELPASNVIETITINGNNPYVVYRHTQRVIKESGEVIGDRLSIGIYPRKTLQPFLVEEKAVISEGSDVVRHNRYQLLPDNEGNMTLNYGVQVNDNSKKIPLPLIKQSDVWNEYEGNIGTTGAGIESMLERKYFNGETSH